MLNPNISVCVLVAHVEHFFELFQEYQQLFLVGEDIAVHRYDDALLNALYYRDWNAVSALAIISARAELSLTPRSDIISIASVQLEGTICAWGGVRLARTCSYRNER